MGTILIIIVVILLLGVAAAITRTAATAGPDSAAFLAWLFSFSCCFGFLGVLAAWAGCSRPPVNRGWAVPAATLTGGRTLTYSQTRIRGPGQWISPPSRISSHC